MLDKKLEEWTLSQAYLRLCCKQYDQCCIILNGLLEMSSNNASALSLLSFALLEMGNPLESLKIVDRYYQCSSSLSEEKKQLDEIVGRIKSRAQLRANKQS